MNLMQGNRYRFFKTLSRSLVINMCKNAYLPYVYLYMLRTLKGVPFVGLLNLLVPVTGLADEKFIILILTFLSVNIEPYSSI